MKHWHVGETSDYAIGIENAGGSDYHVVVSHRSSDKLARGRSLPPPLATFDGETHPSYEHARASAKRALRIARDIR